MKYTESKVFLLMVAEELLLKAQEELCYLEIEVGDQAESIQDTLSMVINLIRDCQ